MAIDPYAACPCGSGKKLKFCCKDLAADIEKIQKMIAGEQPHAALTHVSQLLERQPGRTSLLDIQASLQLSLHEFDGAAQTIDAYLAADPQAASAYAQRAILLSATEKWVEAIASLQDSFDRVEEEMPLRVLEAIGAVGHALLMEGNLVAARGHLLLYAGIAPQEDNQAIELMLRMNLQSGLPLLVREYLLLAPCPADVPWQAQFDEAKRLATRGLWRRAEAMFDKLVAVAGHVPELVYNLALLHGWLGRLDEFAADLHQYAQLDVPEDSAVEAEALAQLLDPELNDPGFDIVKMTFPVEDADALIERLNADKRTDDYELASNQSYDDKLAEPTKSYMLLDRAALTTGVDLVREDVPNVVGFLSIFGKRTDRTACLEMTTDRRETFDQVKSLLVDIVGDTVGELQEEEVVAEKSISEESLSWRWRLPDDTPLEHRRTLLAERRREAILDRWTAAPRAALGGKSPQAAVDDPALAIALRASALIIEQAVVDPAELPLYVELRQKLRLPEPGPVDLDNFDLEHLPLVRVRRLELSKLDSNQLAKLLDRTVLMGANFATLLVAAELVARPDVADGVDRATAFRQLIRLEPDYQGASDWIDKARDWAKHEGLSEAEWALMGLQLSIERGQTEEVRRLLSEIRTNHIEEPGVAEATYRLLYSAGLVAPPEEAMTSGGAPSPNAQFAEADSGGKIWTPGEDESSVAEEKKSVIWTP